MKVLSILLPFLLSVHLPAQLLIPGWRGGEGTSHAEWDLFTQAKFEANAPDVAFAPDVFLISTTPSAFLTSNQNIYSFQAPLRLQLDGSTKLNVRNLLLQVRTLGAGLDTEGAMLLLENEAGKTVSRSPDQIFVTSEEELNGERGGIGTNYGLQWDLREDPLTGSYTLLFGASTTSLSLDRVALDLSESYLKVGKPETLQVQSEGGEIVVSWLGKAQLQKSRTLDGEWTDVPLAEGVNTVRLPRETGATFFRLKK